MEWQPIETAPKDGTSILGYTEYGIIEVFYCCDVEFDRWCQDVVAEGIGFSNDPFLSEITHWMQLPPPPKIE